MRKQAIWLALVVCAIGFVRALPARAWGDDGHEIVAAIARAYLTPAAKKRVDALLKADLDPLTEPKNRTRRHLGRSLPGGQYRRVAAGHAAVAFCGYRTFRARFAPRLFWISHNGARGSGIAWARARLRRE